MDGNVAGTEAGEFASEWTMPRSGVDFTGFTIHTPDDAPWGGDDEIVTMTVALHVASRKKVLETSRTTTPVRYDERMHMVVGRAVDGRKPSDLFLGLRALVNLRIDRKQWGSAGGPEIVAMCRCLAVDADRMEALAAKTIRAELATCVAQCRKGMRALDDLAARATGGTTTG